MTAADDADDAVDEPEDGAGGAASAHVAGPEAAGERLDRWLAAVSGLSRSRVRALIEEGRLTAGEAGETDPSARVRPGAAYRLDAPAPVAADPRPEAIPLVVLHEDAHLIVVDKPAGLVVHPAAGQPAGTLVNALLHHCGPSLAGIGGVARPGIVHRLDKDTSGVMVAAKTQAAHAGLAALFAAHDIERRYLAVTRGAPRPLAGTIATRIARSTQDRKKMAVVREPTRRRDHWSDDPAGSEPEARGKPAVTHYRTLAAWGRTSPSQGESAAALVECRLETGRTHQIRVHLAHIGAPVLGDPIYGRSPAPRLSRARRCTPRCWASSIRSPARRCASRRRRRPTWRR
jgi:23S rRNA pseudouridine1911/1915/1917 synthase